MSRPARVADRGEAAGIADLLVIGGGPAGSATAIAARRRGLGVILLERGRPPFGKVCGEFLSRPGMEIFERLTGISRDGFPRLESVVFRSGPRHTRAHRLDPPAWGVRRSTLDTELLKACAAAGVDVRFGVRAGRLSFEAGEWRVGARSADPPDRRTAPATLTFHATRLVRADGRRPTSSRRNAWIGRRIYSPAGPTGPDVEISLVGGGGYYGRSRVDGGAFNLCGLAHAAAPAWQRAASGDAAIDPGDPAGSAGTTAAPAIIAAPAVAPTILSTPLFSLGLQRRRDPLSFPVGDALATWPPVMGDGMTMAMITGSLLGERLGERGFAAADWIGFWRRRHGKLLGKALVLHAMLESEALRSTLIRAESIWPSFGDWLIHRARFAEALG